jgi:hypothetical protein
MIEVETVDAASTIQLLESIKALYPILVLIDVFLDNARYHQAKLARDWLARPERRFKLLMSEAILARDRGESPNDHPALSPAHEPVE